MSESDRLIDITCEYIKNCTRILDADRQVLATVMLIMSSEHTTDDMSIHEIADHVRSILSKIDAKAPRASYRPIIVKSESIGRLCGMPECARPYAERFKGV